MSGGGARLSRCVLSLVRDVVVASDGEVFCFQDRAARIERTVGLVVSRRFSRKSGVGTRELLRVRGVTRRGVGLGIRVRGKDLFRAVFQRGSAVGVVVYGTSRDRCLSRTSFILRGKLP